MINNTTETNYLDVGPSRLAYDRTGNGPDLLFIHGWPLSRATWRDLVAGLPDATCHTIDLPGCGESITPANTPVSLAGHIDAVVDAIEQLDLEQLVLVGHDSGGLIARMAAARLGDKIAGLILIGTEVPGQHPKIIDQLQMMMKLPGSVAAARKLLSSPKVTRSNRMLGGFFWDRDLLEGSFRSDVLGPVLDTPGVLDRQFEVLETYTHDFVDQLEQAHAAISCPTLLICGERDLFFPPDTAKAMLDQFGGPTQFELVPNARLLVHEEHPALVAELTEGFLSGLTPAPSSQPRKVS